MTNWNVLNGLDSAIRAIPAPALAAVLMLTAVLMALALFWLLVRLMRHVFADRNPLVFSFIRRCKGLLRYAMILLALSIAARNIPYDPQLAAGLGRLFQVGFIVMLGWLALIAINMAADVYLLRFRVDVEDNLLARKHVTQVRVLRRTIQTVVVLIAAASAMMTFEAVRQFGVSLFASAGIAGIVVGFAARPLLTSLLAGLQIAMTQPIRIDDAVVVENEWGWVEEITATYVVIKLWDWRRMIVPLSYFMEKPFQNWTRETASLIGTVFIYVDYTAPISRLRTELERIARQSPLWDGNVVNLQVTDARGDTIELRMLVSGRNSPQVWDLRCAVREQMIEFLQREYPSALPRRREEHFRHAAEASAPGERALSAVRN